MKNLLCFISFFCLVQQKTFAFESCIKLLNENQSNFIWRAVTARDATDYLDELDALNQLIQAHGLEVPEFNLSSNQSVLSLGEGESNFIDSLLVANPQGLYHAVDAQRSAGFNLYKSKWPLNYHNAYFQNLNIKSTNGLRLGFDEIISSWSLDFVVRGTLIFKSTKVVKLALEHLNLGGVLRVWPVNSIGRWVEVLDDLEKLYGIKSTIKVIDDRPGSYFVVITKVSEKELKAYFIKKPLNGI